MKKTQEARLSPGRSETRSARISKPVENVLSELAQVLVDIALSRPVAHQEADGVIPTPAWEGEEKDE
jgi:hypothetical protein